MINPGVVAAIHVVGVHLLHVLLPQHRDWSSRF